MQIILTISKQAVLDEVAQTTDYTGAKLTGDESGEAYDRIKTVDSDKSALERFWDECRSNMAKRMINLLADEAESGDNYTVTLNVSASFPASTGSEAATHTALKNSMQDALFSYMVQGITAKWYVYAKKDEVEQYAARADAALDDMRAKAFFKKTPKRPYHQ